jgi:recombinational DNA repair protein RecT
MSQELSTTPKADTLSTWLARPEARQTITGALGGYLDTEEFLSQLLIHIQTTPATKFAPALAACTLSSQYKAVTICATLGLLPNFQQVALIPRKNGSDYELTVMPQWQGFKALFERVPEVREARVAAVHVNDHFITGGDGLDMQVLEHQYDPFDPQRQILKLDDIRGTYCRFTFRDGRPDRFHFAPTHYIAKCKGCAGTDVIWAKWFEQMALKTAFRSAYSRRVVNIDPVVQGRVEAFLAHEDALLGNDPRMVDQSRVQALPPVSRAAAIAQRLNERTVEGQVRQASEMPLPTEEPALEQEPEPEASQEQEQQEPSEAVADFVEMWSQATPQNEASLTRLYKHFTREDANPPLSDEDRRRVSQKHDEIAATLTRNPKQRASGKSLLD